MRRATPLFAGLFLVVSSFSDALAQESQPQCCARFDYVLERTIFKVDAVRLELTVLGETPDRAAELVSEQVDPRPSPDSVAALYLSADRADVRMVFLRSFGLKRFLDANRNAMQKLVSAGLLTDAEFRRLDTENAGRFGILAADGIRDGDRLEHEVRGDTVSTRYVDVTGAVRVDEIRIGSEQRRVLLGSLFGPQSGFRKGLLDLVFERAERKTRGN
jgi:hypothetical protein